MDKFIQLPLANPLTAEIDHLGIWHITITIGCACIILGLLSKFKNLAIEARILWGYLLLSALYYFEFPWTHFGVFDTAFQVQAAQVFTEALLIPLGAIYFSRQIFRILPFVIVFELFSIWFGFDGLMLATSFDSAFCAIALPFLPWWLGYAVVISIITHHGSTALMILAAQIFSLVMKNKKTIPAFLISLPLLYLAAKLNTHGFGFFDGESRLDVYKKFMNFWVSRPRWAPLGIGPGSFLWGSALMNKMEEGLWVGGVWMQMHSDWLQILWELGVVGLALVLAVFGRAIKNAWHSPRHLAAIFGCAAFGLTYHPLRFFPPALLIACIFWRALNQETSLKLQCTPHETRRLLLGRLDKLRAKVTRHL